jgi:FixJ family two-component response regulator
MLEDAGLKVLECASAQAALEREDLDDIALLVSDVIMPEMMGTELAATLRERRPDLPVLLMSGYPQPALEETPSEARTWFLRKPICEALLRETLRAALQGGREAEHVACSAAGRS